MKNLKYILLLVFLVSCGSKKSSLEERTKLSQELSSNEADKIFKDSITFQNWNWIKKTNYDLTPVDPEKPSSVQFDKDLKTVKFQNAKIHISKIKISDSTKIEDRSTLQESKEKKVSTTNLISEKEQSEDREQWKLTFLSFAPLLLIIGVAYCIYNYRALIYKWIINNF
jgi:ATP-dependent Zn protease